MKKYTIFFSRKAEKVFDRIVKRDKRLAIKLTQAIDELQEEPHLGTVLMGKLKGLYRLRVGDYRIIYAIESKKVIIYIVDLGHRRDLYK